jgi:tetraacyldisaccharide-1-P 4'-kinase
MNSRIRHRNYEQEDLAAALAQARKATLVTSDKDFERAGPALKVLWL